MRNIKINFPELKIIYSIVYTNNCNMSAQCGILLSLKYANETGCSWCENTCLRESAHGHLDCLR